MYSIIYVHCTYIFISQAAKPEIGLFMECVDDELSEAQKDFNKTRQKAFDVSNFDFHILSS